MPSTVRVQWDFTWGFPPCGHPGPNSFHGLLIPLSIRLAPPNTLLDVSRFTQHTVFLTQLNHSLSALRL